MWCRARCNRRRIIPPQCQWCQQLSAARPGASASNRSRGARHRARQPAGSTPRRPHSRRHPGAPGAVSHVPESDHAAARCAHAPNGQCATRIRSRRRASGVAGATRLRRRESGSLARGADGRGVPNRRARFCGELRHPDDDAGGVGVVPPPTQPRRPYPGSIQRDDGIPCCPSFPAGASMGARGRRAAVRTVGAKRRAQTAVVAARQADRRVRGPAGAGEARRAADRAGRQRLCATRHRRRRRRPGQTAIGNAHSGFHRCAVRRGARRGVCQHGRLRAYR